MKSKLRLVGAFLLLALIIALLLPALFSYHWGRQVEAEVHKIKAAGAPTTMMDLGKPVIPDSENAAILLQPVLNTISKNEESSEQIARLFDDKKYPQNKQEWKQIEVAMAALGGVPADAYEVINIPQTQWPINWEDGAFGVIFPHLRQLRDLSRLVAADAILKARHGDKAGCLKSLQLALNLPEKVGANNSQTISLVQIAMQKIALRSVQKSIALSDFTPTELAEIAGYISQAKRIDLVKSMEGERACGIDLFETVRTRGITVADWLDEIETKQPSSTHPALRSLKAYLNKPAIYLDQRQYLEVMAMQIDEVKRAKFDPDFSNKLQSKLQSMSAYSTNTLILVQVYSNGKVAALKAQANRHMAIAALGLESYRQQKGQYPSSLDDLKQIGWQKIEMDPFSQKPFIYRKQGDSYLLYSVGENQKDDGGKGESATKSTYGIPLDLLWSDL